MLSSKSNINTSTEGLSPFSLWNVGLYPTLHTPLYSLPVDSILNLQHKHLLAEGDIHLLYLR